MGLGKKANPAQGCFIEKHARSGRGKEVGGAMEGDRCTGQQLSRSLAEAAGILGNTAGINSMRSSPQSVHGGH